MDNEITVIDIGIGNVASVLKALKRAGGAPVLSHDPLVISKAGKLLLPGVGAFGPGAEALQKYQLFEPIREAVLARQVPILGLCMGMQLFATRGFENGDFSGLDLIPAEVRQLEVEQCGVLPHMGWNNLESTQNMRLFEGLGPSPHFYFVHSFHMTLIDPRVNVSCCRYGTQEVTAAVQLGNIHGTQFHPEKSLANGIHALRNFVQHA